MKQTSDLKFGNDNANLTVKQTASKLYGLVPVLYKIAMSLGPSRHDCGIFTDFLQLYCRLGLQFYCVLFGFDICQSYYKNVKINFIAFNRKANDELIIGILRCCA